MQRDRDMEQAEQTPLKCPRCNSVDTKFRYFNNNNPTQPRHYCKNCKRQWTVGGNLRNIPIGGKATKASSSSCGDLRSNEARQPWLSLSEQHQQKKSDTTMYQPITNMSPLDAHCFNDEISCLDVIQSLIQPEINSHHVSSNAMILQESHQSYQTCDITTNVHPISHLYSNGVDDFNFTTSNVCLWNDFSGDATNTEDSTSVNVDEWLNFPRDDPP